MILEYTRVHSVCEFVSCTKQQRGAHDFCLGNATRDSRCCSVYRPLQTRTRTLPQPELLFFPLEPRFLPNTNASLFLESSN